MFYMGKQYDTFGPAVVQMLLHYRLTPALLPDCASLRSFGFHAEGPVEKWFCPFVSLTDSTENLSKSLGIGFVCQQISSFTDLPSDCRCVMLGPLKKGLAVSDIWEYYYEGDGRFLVCVMIDNKVQVYDPCGVAGMTVRYNRLAQIVFPCFAIWLDWSIPSSILEPSELLFRGIQYHRKIAIREMDELTQACASYVPDRKSGMSLRCGLINMILHLDQVFRLASECGMTVERGYQEEKQRLYACYQNCTTDGLAEAVEKIWMLLD